MNKKSKNTMIVSVIALALVLIGVTYAYFSARITGLESASTISLTAGRMGIQYSEGDENVTFTNIYPREEAWVTKTFTLTGYNTTDQPMKYDIGLNVITNTFPNNYLTYDLTLLSGNNGTPVASKTGVSINGTGKIKIGVGTFVQANGAVHSYELKIYFKDNGQDQNDAQEAVFNAKIFVSEMQYLNCVADSTNSTNLFAVTSFDVNVENCKAYKSWMTDEQSTKYCNKETVTDEYNNEYSLLEDVNSNAQYLVDSNIITNVVYGNQLLNNGQYVNGQFTYTFISKKWDNNLGENVILPENEQGWLVEFADKDAEDITSSICSMINGKPLISMLRAFGDSKIAKIDFSDVDTSHVTDMSDMFA